MGIMQHRFRTYLYALLLLAFAACRHDDFDPGRYSAKVEMSLGQGLSSRAHFVDNEGVASFVWDVDGSMIAVVAGTDGIAVWDGGYLYSPMSISLIDQDSPNRVLRASSLRTLPGDAAAAGSGVCFLSPAFGSESVTTDAGATLVSACFSMPDQFSQSSSRALEEFADYCYIRGESSIKSSPSAGNKNFLANATIFRAIPATFRFNVTNGTEEDVIMESVKISCDKLFPDKLCWRTDGNSASVSETDDKSGYFNTIKTTIGKGYGDCIASRSGEKTATGTYYAMCLPFDDASSMEGATLAFILETSDKVYTFNVPASQFFRDCAVATFESNRIYTFNFLMTGKSVELENVSVSDWENNPFYLPTEEISAELNLNVSYWVQDRVNLYTFGFQKMIGSGSECTMWSECNIGEYISSASDYKVCWRGVTPSSEDDVDYLSIYHNGITDFKWKTPSRSDFSELMDGGNTMVGMIKDEASSCFGLKISRTSDPEVYIFLPCELAADEVNSVDEEGRNVISRTFHGKYWTLDEVDDDNAFLFHFAFSQVETIEDGVSTFSSFSPALEEGSALYQFIPESKTAQHTVRAILK